MLDVGPQDTYCQYQLTASGFGMQVVPPNFVTGVRKAIQANCLQGNGIWIPDIHQDIQGRNAS